MLNNQCVILYLNSFPKLSETFIVNKFLGLLNKGWNVHVVCMESDPLQMKNFPNLAQYPNISQRLHVRWPHRPRWLAALLIPVTLLRCLIMTPQITFQFLSSGWNIFGLDVLRRLYLDAEIILLKPTIVHFEFGTLALEHMYFKELLGCKTLVSFRGYDLNFAGTDNLEFYNSVWEQADMLHLLSEDLWHVAQLRGCPDFKAHVIIPPAIDAAYFVRTSDWARSDPSRPVRILSVGRLEWKKGYEYALQAVRLLLDRGVPCEYHLIGGGDYREALYFARHQLNLEAASALLGDQPSDKVKAEMGWADIFLHPSLSEGFCNVVMEAQSMGIPVVASDAGGLPENIETDVTGYVVPRRDPKALADKLEILAKDFVLRKKMGEAGRKRVLEHFQLEDQIRRFEETYSYLEQGR